MKHCFLIAMVLAVFGVGCTWIEGPDLFDDEESWFDSGSSQCDESWLDTTPTPGDNGVVTFQGQSCLFGCGLINPIALGSNERIDLRNTSGAIGVESVDSAVLRVASVTFDRWCPGNATVVVEAVTEGTTQLRVVREGGSVIDLIEVIVGVPTQLEIQPVEEFDESGSYVAGVDRPHGFAATIRDASGRHLIGDVDFEWRLESDVATLEENTTALTFLAVVDPFETGDAELFVGYADLETSLEIQFISE